MRAAIYNGPRSIEVGERPDPLISEPTDAVVPHFRAGWPQHCANGGSFGNNVVVRSGLCTSCDQRVMPSKR
jgi:hypothetical protein